MKTLKSLLILLLFSVANMAMADDLKFFSVTDNPTIDRQYRSNYGSGTITQVALTDQVTIVTFNYYVNSNVSSPWISLSSSTTMTVSGSSRTYKIQGWGYYDANDDLQSLNLNEHSTLRAGNNYKFYMLFDPVLTPTTCISINENIGSGGFYWTGIHLNKYQSASSSNGRINERSKINKNSQKPDEQETIAKFIVTSAKENGHDITENVTTKGGCYTVFYTVGDEAYMANCFDKQDSQSYGRIYNFTSSKTDETANQYASEEYRFSWSYKNSYDNKTGTCQCVLTKIYKPQGVLSILKMVTESLDAIEYTGYMEGTLDFSGF